MTGIVMISHGELAQGVLSAAAMLYPHLDGVEALGLQSMDNPDAFRRQLKEAVARLDTGDGVFILADLLGGTPCNQAMQFVSGGVKLLAGLSLPMLLSLLGIREMTTNLDDMVDYALDKAITSTVCVNNLMK